MSNFRGAVHIVGRRFFYISWFGLAVPEVYPAASAFCTVAWNSALSYSPR